MLLMRQSLYQCHVERWRNGCGADICQRATRKVFARGDIPCDILMIGEAPGDAEDSTGIPFVGPAGQLLDRIVAQSIPSCYRVCFYNLLGCIPLDEFGEKEKEPPDEAIEACKPRLEEFITIALPRLIIQVGKHARDWLEQGTKISVKLPDRNTPMIQILHPAFILRQNIAQQSMLRKRTVLAISDAIEQHLGKSNGSL